MERYVNALARVRARTPLARLYALVDGHRFTEVFEEAVPGHDAFALYAGTEEDNLTHAGPWLLDAEAHGPVCEQLSRLQALEPICTWLISPLPVHALGQVLQLRMVAELPDGREALVRFHDPRVVHRLAVSMDRSQREAFFAHIEDWHFFSAGEHRWVGRA